MTSIWQQLGAFVGTGKDLGNEHLDHFSDVGGKWIVPVLYGDDIAGPWNLANIGSLKARASARGIKTGGWFNCFGGNPVVDATAISNIVRYHGLNPVILDLESAYQEQPDLFPKILKEVQTRLPIHDLCISTNSLNDSLIWNGRGLQPQESARKLGYRVAPQWYNSPHYSGCWTDPVCNMKWLWENGTKDNFYDKDYANHRAVPLSYVHPTLEFTGVEDSTLKEELVSLTKSKAWGFTVGFSLYLLERAPENDWPLIATQRGSLYLG